MMLCAALYTGCITNVKIDVRINVAPTGVLFTPIGLNLDQMMHFLHNFLHQSQNQSKVAPNGLFTPIGVYCSCINI